jgi:hypothetical protein
MRNEEQPLGSGRVLPLSSSSGSQHREFILGGDDGFDYVSVYLNEDERRQNGMYNGGLVPSPPQNVGHENGTFATRLED